MLDFMGKRLQKSIAKIKSKTIISEVDLLEITREIKMSLLEADVNLIIVKKFVNQIKEKVMGQSLIGKLNPGQQMIKIVLEELKLILGSKTSVVNLPKKGIIMMVGLQGSGKTTTVAKLAKFLSKKNGFKKPLMVAADIYRPAAIDQLVTLGKQLQIEVFSKGINVNPIKIVRLALNYAKSNENDLIVIDTAGRLSIDEKLMIELEGIKKIASPHEIFFVADAMSGQDIINVSTTFHERLSLTGTIITKLDSDARAGAALSIRYLLNLPIKFIGVGEKISDIDVFHPERMAKRILGMGDIVSLMEKASEVIDEKKSKRMLNRMISGHFDLNDLLGQLKQMKKMGKMSKILKMIPGSEANNLSSSQVDFAEKKLSIFEILISSMTNQERKNPKLLKNPSRKERIRKGSARSNQEYNLLVSEFEKMSKQMKTIAKRMKDGSFSPRMLS